jgi:diguanylate cyclase (GGDEF)-like protein
MVVATSAIVPGTRTRKQAVFRAIRRERPAKGARSRGEMSLQMATSDLLTSSGSAPRHQITPEQRRRLLDVPSSLPPWLSPAQLLRAAAQEIAFILGTPAAVVGEGPDGWRVLGESREDSSTLGSRIATDASFAASVKVLDARDVVRWQPEGREYTLTALRFGAGHGHVVLVLDGDWTSAGSELVECAMALASPGTSPSTGPHADSAEHFARELTKVTDVIEACGMLLRFAVDAVPSRYGSVAVPRDDGTLAIAATRGYPLALASHVRIDPGRGPIGAAYERGQPLLVHDINAFAGGSHQRPRFRTPSCAAVPVMAGARVLAVLCLADRSDDGPFTAADVDRLRGFAAPLALALARLHSEGRAQELSRAAIVDPGSGLFNRLYFQSRLDEELQRASRQRTPLSMQIIDIDSFKAINDRFGHLAGDAVLKDVADILRRSVRVFDVCARYGGDEFAVVMPGSTLDSATVVAERIRGRIHERQPATADDPAVTVSVGVAELRVGEQARDVIERADRALYEAKKGGKNRVVASPS